VRRWGSNGNEDVTRATGTCVDGGAEVDDSERCEGGRPLARGTWT
jgi:hypothetical protein